LLKTSPGVLTLFELINPRIDWQGIVPEEKLSGLHLGSFSDPERFRAVTSKERTRLYSPANLIYRKRGVPSYLYVAGLANGRYY